MFWLPWTVRSRTTCWHHWGGWPYTLPVHWPRRMNACVHVGQSQYVPCLACVTNKPKCCMGFMERENSLTANEPNWQGFTTMAWHMNYDDASAFGHWGLCFRVARPSAYPSVRPSEARNTLCTPVHGSVGPSDQPWPFFGLSARLSGRLSVRPSG